MSYDAWKTTAPDWHDCFDPFSCHRCHELHDGANLKEMKNACEMCAQLLEDEIKAGNFCRTHEEDCNCETISGAA